MNASSRADPLLRVLEARSFLGRARGLLGRPALAPGCGLLLPGVNSVHGFGMLHAIDIVFLDRRGVIVRCVQLPPWRVARCATASHVIELRHGEAARLGLRKNIRPILQHTVQIFVCQGGDEPAAVRSKLMIQSLAAFAASVTCVVGQETACAAGSPGSPAAEWIASPLPGASAKAAVPPAGLQRPIDPQTLRRLQGEADRLYRDSAADRADVELIRLYETMATAAPQRAFHAWLRIGNIHQRAGAVGAAIDAYRRALQAAEVEDPQHADEKDSRRKALLNLASLALDQARQALSQLPALPVAAAHLEHFESLAERVAREASLSGSGRSDGNQTAVPQKSADPRLREPPYIVERYTASGRRNAVKGAKGSLHLDPADQSPAKPVSKPRSRFREQLPRVEYLLGDPQRFKPAADAHAAGQGHGRQSPASDNAADPGNAPPSANGPASGHSATSGLRAGSTP